MAAEAETFAFQADINQLLSLIINTFYSNKEIFLRELISNSSDALDKIRFESLTDKSKLDAEPELFIRIIPDGFNNTLTVVDSGVGMRRSDLVSNLGTIARSGTKEFMEALAAGADLGMIGQFGVGFYSAFLVADKVVVTSKHNDDGDQYVWESEAAGGCFTVARGRLGGGGNVLGRGTKITLQLKADQLEYLEERRLREVIKKHSGFVAYPISLWTERAVLKELCHDDDDDDDDGNDGGDEEVVEKRFKKTKVISHDWRVVNEQKPIWMRRPEEVRRYEYAALYRSLTREGEDHLAVKHFAAEGQLEFRAVLFVPRSAPYDLFDARRKLDNMRLYVRRVFVMGRCAEMMMPKYLRFVRGVVDSDDLPLNVSREALQKNKIVEVIRKRLVKKCLELFIEIARREEDYTRFYAAFSKNIKLGIHDEDAGNRAKLLELLRFHTSKDGKEMSSLGEYVARMKEGQRDMYYLTGQSKTAVERSPLLEKLKKRDYEVLFMVDAIDEYALRRVKEYQGRKLVSAAAVESFELELHTDVEDQKRRFRRLCGVMKDVLGDRVEKVVVSDRVVDSPCCLVTSDHGWTANMRRILMAQPLQDPRTAAYASGGKVMEINPENLIVDRLRKLADDDHPDGAVEDQVLLLFETALLTSGFFLDDPNTFAGRIYRFLKVGLNIDDDERDAPAVEATHLDRAADAEEPDMEQID